MRIAAFLVSLCLLAAPLAAADPERLVGTFHVVWGDSPPELDWEHYRAFFLTDDQGRSTELSLSEELIRAAGGVQLWNGRRVEVTLAPDPEIKAAAVDEGREGAAVAALRALPAKAENELLTKAGVSGSQPWVSILCKFSDKAVEPRDLAFFQGMYDNSPGRLDDYWRELSYNQIDIAGSTAVNWVTLPHPQTYYIPTPGSSYNANLTALFNDCTAAANPFVDFSNGGTPFVGINMMFNDILDCCAWGGGMYASLDGITKSWRVTWEPPWGYANSGVIGHEMGHGFGLPHSTNSDNDGYAYDSPWDVMSSATGYSIYDGTYGSRGKHTIAYHKDVLGWIPDARRFEVTNPGSFTVTIDQMAVADTSNYRMAEIPIGDGSTFYTVEVRRREGDYEGNLPGDAVIIHHVDPTRIEPAWVVDADNPAAGYADTEGVMWEVGETFEDEANEIAVAVLSSTVDGFVVRIDFQAAAVAGMIFSDVFESGSTSAWSVTVN